MRSTGRHYCSTALPIQRPGRKAPARLFFKAIIPGTSLTFLIIAEILLHLVAVASAFALRAASAYGSKGIPAALPLLLVTGGLAFTFIFMLSRSLNGIVQVLYTRADLDLLLTEDIDPPLK